MKPTGPMEPGRVYLRPLAAQAGLVDHTAMNTTPRSRVASISGHWQLKPGAWTTP